MKRFQMTKIVLVVLALLPVAAFAASPGRSGSASSAHGTPILPAVRPAGTGTAQAGRAEAIAKRAHAVFWKAFQNEDYAQIGEVIHLLTAAYLTNPKNPDTTLLLAHAYLWRGAERARGDAPRTRILASLVMADRFFQEAYRLSPDDGRIVGWLGSVRLPLAEIMQDKAGIKRAEATLRLAVKRYPRFNDFTFAYSFANWPADSKQFADGLRHMQATLNICPNLTIGHKDNKGIKLTQRVKAACANTDKAPYNIEGFLMSYGDMLIKAGQYAKAASIYKKAEASPDYATWPYKASLSKRLRRMHAILEESDKKAASLKDFPMMFGSKYSCAACHAKR